MLSVTAPARTTSESSFTKNSGSLRVASSGLNSTLSVKHLACSTAVTAALSTSSGSIWSLNFMCSGLDARKVWMPQFSASFSASTPRSMSLIDARHRDTTVARSHCWPMAFTLSKSPGELAANPASMTSTPRRSSCLARVSFSLADMENPGACSPSRSVVSKILTFSIVPLANWDLRHCRRRPSP